MANLDGNLWEHNLTLVRVVDVSDDYRLMQPPLPSECYPVIGETWLPTFGLSRRLPEARLVEGFLYDWHEPATPGDPWVVGVVAQELAMESPGAAKSAAPGSPANG